VFVLGQEMARAIKKEEQHRTATGAVTSPLAEVAYDPDDGALDLHRFVESPIDNAIGKFAASYEKLGYEKTGDVRASLTMDDLYTLLAFARRSALASLQSRDRPSLHHGLVALTAVDAERVDWRDVSVAAELLGWAVARAGGDHAIEFQRMSERSERGVAETLGRIASRPASELEPGMWRAVETAAGPILADDDFERFEPTADLVGIALGIRDVLEEDVYRVSSLTVATELPQVWLTPTDRAGLERSLGAIRACVSVQAQPDSATTSTAGDQQLLVFLAEAGNEEDARLIAAAAVPTTSHQALGLAKDRLCCVVVANAFVVGVPSFEGEGALERFYEPLLSILDRPAKD
jgi:hypothetical protein